jgi:hypothetical protein
LASPGKVSGRDIMVRLRIIHGWIAAIVSGDYFPDRNIHGLLGFRDDKTVMTRIDVAFPVLYTRMFFR